MATKTRGLSWEKIRRRLIGDYGLKIEKTLTTLYRQKGRAVYTSQYCGARFFEGVLNRLYHNYSVRTVLEDPAGERADKTGSQHPYYPRPSTFYHRMELLKAGHRGQDPLVKLWAAYLRIASQEELMTWRDRIRACRASLIEYRPGQSAGGRGMIAWSSWFQGFEDRLRRELEKRGL